jgi:Fur family ferric uptake transcriptional regulator
MAPPALNSRVGQDAIHGSQPAYAPKPRSLTLISSHSYDPRVTNLKETSERLEGVGYRLTPSRRAVLGAISTSRSPFTVEDICSAVPLVGRATVFRTMKLLHELDVVCRVPLEDGSVRYSVSRSGHHHHLVCGECGAVEEFSDPALDVLIQEKAASHRFELDGHSLELYGRCFRCAGGGRGP